MRNFCSVIAHFLISGSINQIRRISGREKKLTSTGEN